MSTAMLIFNHGQTVSILGAMSFVWPPKLKMIVDAVRLKLQLVVDIECAVENIDLYWTFAVVGCGPEVRESGRGASRGGEC